MTMTKVGNREEWVVDRVRLTNVHPEGTCAGEHCVLHNPSNHSMREWEMTAGYVAGYVMMYRVCEHGALHNDPDSQAFVENALDVYLSAPADCDGCCA